MNLKNGFFKNESIGVQKIDGVSCSLIYENGRLELAKTRGDGTFEEDITNKVIWLSDIPKISQFKIVVKLREKCSAKKTPFSTCLMRWKKLGWKPTSLRNIVAGLLGRKDSVFLAKYLSFFAFDLIGDFGLKKEREKYSILKENQFQTPEVFHFENTKRFRKSN